MINKISSYIKFLLKSKSCKNIHSPFVFDFIESILLNKDIYYSFLAIEFIRKQLQADYTIININDLGAGSKGKKVKTSSISKIAFKSLQKDEIAQLLFKIINNYKLNNRLELGTSLGITTSYMSTAIKNKGKVYTIEANKETSNIAAEVFNKLKLKNINLITDEFSKVLPDIVAKIDSLDFAYFDGNHSKIPTLEYFNICKKASSSNSVFVFDDIYWSKSMQEAWQEIKKDEKVTLTIDLYRIGIVFFHPVRVKTHYKLRGKFNF